MSKLLNDCNTNPFWDIFAALEETLTKLRIARARRHPVWRTDKTPINFLSYHDFLYDTVTYILSTYIFFFCFNTWAVLNFAVQSISMQYWQQNLLEEINF